MNVPVSLYWIVLVLYISINIWGTLNISSQFFLPTKFKGVGSNGSVSITFDDGPVPGATHRILEILKKHGANATFFCIGKNVNAQPELVRQILQEGHLFGNHSYFHGSFFDLQSGKKMMDELINTNDAIREATGQVPRFFRPPYGVTNPMLANAVSQLKLITVGWSVRSFDTIAKKRNRLLHRVTKNLQAGDIILFHDRCEITKEILPDLLAYIAKAGLKVEPLDKLLGERAYA